MNRWSRGIELLILVAVLQSLLGLTVDAVGTSDTSATTDFNSLTCSCDYEELKCSCSMKVNINVMGCHKSFDPHIQLAMVTDSLAIHLTVRSNGKTFVEDKVVGILEDEKLPSICVTLPVLSVIEMCIESEKVIVSREHQSISFCLKFGINFVGFRLQIHPTLPLGCFLATKGKKLRYSFPAFPDTVKTPLKRVLTHTLSRTLSFNPYGCD